MYRAYTFRLKPTVGQSAQLAKVLTTQCQLYNAALEERRGAWQWERRRIRLFDQYRELTGWEWPPLQIYGIGVARGTLTRLDEAFVGFFRRIAAGQTPGFPRFKAQSRFDSVGYPDGSGWRLQPDRKRLYLKGVGTIRCLVRGRMRGIPKTITVRRRENRWEVTVLCAKVERERLLPTGRSVGIDLGIVVLAATSDGEFLPNARPRRRQAERLSALQRDLHRRRVGSIRHRLSSEAIVRLRRKEANIRKNTAHQVSRWLVNRYDLICMEDLKVSQMMRSAKGTMDRPGRNVAAKAALNNAIADSGWAMLARYISYKAEDAGRDVVLVDPRHTSTTCSNCGNNNRANRPTQARFHCKNCGTETNADVNAARNILRAGLAQHLGAKSDQFGALE